MTANTACLTVGDCEREIGVLLAAAETLYAGSDKLPEIRDAAESFLADIRGLLGNRGLAVPTIGFIGDKNAGKSYLLRLLIRDEAVRAHIPSGLGSDGRTEKLIWLGAALPPALDPGAELGIRLHDPAKQLRLEEDITLVDIPGFNDAHGDSAQRARELALKSCQVKVLVVDVLAATADRAAEYARLAAGPIIVPVLNLVRDPLDSPEARKLAGIYEESIRSAITGGGSDSGGGDRSQGAGGQGGDGGRNGATVQRAVLIPDAKIRDPVLEDPARTLARLVGALQSAVAEVRRHPALGQNTARTRQRRFFAELRRVIEPDFRRVSELVEKIERDSRDMPRQLLPHLLGSERAAAAGIRIWLRAEVLHRTPAYFFPLRSFIGLLALTSRAWDSLLLALGGSLPSLFSSVFSIARNVRLLRGRPEAKADEELERAVRRLALDRQHADLVALRRQLDGLRGGTHAPTSSSRDGTPVPRPQVQGLAELRDAAMEAFERIVFAHALPRWPVHLAGWLSIAWCLLLLAGPLWAVYGHHFTTLWRSVAHQLPLAWTDFPVPPPGTVLGWIVLAFLPVFVLALVLQAMAASARRVGRCRSDMERAVEDAMEKLTAHGVLALKLRDPRIDAARRLFANVFPEGASESRPTTAVLRSGSPEARP